MVQPGHLLRFRVNTDEIMAFMGVALETCQAQVVHVVRTTMFYRDNVIHVKGNRSARGGQTTVFAAIPGAASNGLPD
jgi:hypothetical protein